MRSNRPRANRSANVSGVFARAVRLLLATLLSLGGAASLGTSTAWAATTSTLLPSSIYSYGATPNSYEATIAVTASGGDVRARTTAHPSSTAGELSALHRVYVAADSLAGLSTGEQGITSDARAIYGSKAFGEIRAAHTAGTSAEITVNGTTVVYEPGMSASGMTLFGENGFVIGRGAFASDSELAQTIAHESYRLATSASAGGVDAGLAKTETNAAFNFAQQVGPDVMGGP